MTQEEKINILQSLAGSGMQVGQLIIGNEGTINYHDHRGGSGEKKTCTYTDEQLARALENIVGRGKAIDSKQKWAGVLWLLRWNCNYPTNARLACERIGNLPFSKELEYSCDYNNVRPLTTLSFLNEDPNHLDAVKYSKTDEQAFFQLRSVVIALKDELQKE
jgi:hypothetical protein